MFWAVTTLYIGGLPENADSQWVREVFAPVAQIHSARIIRRSSDAKCRGFAYVTLESRDAAAEAVRQIDGTTLEGHALRVDFA